MRITSEAPDRLTHQALSDSRLAAAADQHYGQLRAETQTRAQNHTQTAHEHHLRLAAEMEKGRGLNISAIA